MSNRRATISQADVARVIRACRREGLAIVRIVVRSDGVSVEATDGEGPPGSIKLPLEQPRPVVL